MTKISFVKGIEYLNAYYVNFKFDINDKLAQQIWYQALSEIDNESFELLVTDYAKNNVYAPQSPTHLLEWFDKIYKDNLVKLHTKLSFIESTYLYEIDRYTVKTDYNKAIKECDDPLIAGVLLKIRDKELSNDLKSLSTFLGKRLLKEPLIGIDNNKRIVG